MYARYKKPAPHRWGVSQYINRRPIRPCSPLPEPRPTVQDARSTVEQSTFRFPVT